MTHYLCITGWSACMVTAVNLGRLWEKKNFGCFNIFNGWIKLTDTWNRNMQELTLEWCNNCCSFSMDLFFLQKYGNIFSSVYWSRFQCMHILIEWQEVVRNVNNIKAKYSPHHTFHTDTKIDAVTFYNILMLQFLSPPERNKLYRGILCTLLVKNVFLQLFSDYSFF